MRNLLLACFSVAILFCHAQEEKYHRVKIMTGADGLGRLAAKGIAVDHGYHKHDHSFIGEFSDTELKLIKESGLAYEILITDMAGYYVKRNASAQKDQSTVTCKNCPSYSTPANFTLGSMGGFYTYPELLTILDSMAAKFPNLITVKQPIDTGHTVEGRQLLYVKISDNPNVAETEPQLLFTSLHHAREPESLTQLIFFMWHLLENYGSDPEITYLVNNLEFYFIPCVNPDGYIYNHTTNPGGGGMWRKNRRNNGDGTYGVDLNRNYPYQWGVDNVGSSPNTSSDTYRGPSAGSESEVQMVMRFCNAHQFQLAVNNHTYDNVLVQPYGYAATAYTPDSLTFTEFGMRMTYCDGFMYGTAQQTVGYTANGVSDDWMYGEQSTKPKILAMTPEAGSLDDGFWPASANIIPIAKNTLDQNMYAARLVSTYAEVKDLSGPFIQQNGYIKYNIERLGLQAGNFTITVTPLSGNFQSVGAPNVHSGMTLLQSDNDSISFTLSSGLAPGTPVQFVLQTNNGAYTTNDTITKVYGYPTTIFSDNCSSASQWTGTPWGISSKYAVSPTTSITDSPIGNYGSSWNKTFTTVSNIDLTNAIAAYLEYFARWELEKNYDYVEIKASTNGTTFTPLCALYTHAGNSLQDNGQPLYDGFQRKWVKERIDLSAYIGQNIKLRFNLVSDQGTEYDGFYFDDATVQIITSTSNSVIDLSQNNTFMIHPNPNNGTFWLDLPANTNEKITVQVQDVLGQSVFTEEIIPGNSSHRISLEGLKAGTYFIRTQHGLEWKIQKLILVSF